MSNKNNLTPNERIIRTAAVMLAIGIVGICFSIAKIEDIAARIAILTVSVILVMLAALFISAVAYAKYHATHKRNFFLYDKKKKADIPLDEITLDLVRQKTVDYMSIFQRGKKLYVGELFADTPWSIKPMKPVLCYELLRELAQKETSAEQDCKMFLGYGSDCLSIFSKHLLENSEYELVEKLNFYFSEFESNSGAAKDFADYLASQKEHIEKSMLEYVKTHIDKFVV